MAKAGKDRTSEAREVASDVAVAIGNERRRLQRRLQAALRLQARRVGQLMAAEQSKAQKVVAKRRRQLDEAAQEVADLTRRLALSAGTEPTVTPVATAKAVGAATVRKAAPAAKAAGSAAKAAGTAAKAAGTATGTAAKAAGAATGRAARRVSTRRPTPAKPASSESPAEPKSSAHVVEPVATPSVDVAEPPPPPAAAEGEGTDTGPALTPSAWDRPAATSEATPDLVSSDAGATASAAQAEAPRRETEIEASFDVAGPEPGFDERESPRGSELDQASASLPETPQQPKPEPESSSLSETSPEGLPEVKPEPQPEPEPTDVSDVPPEADPEPQPPDPEAGWGRTPGATHDTAAPPGDDDEPSPASPTDAQEHRPDEAV